MPDISMCLGGGCPVKKECYRYRAVPTLFKQSWFMTPPFTAEGCERFSSLEGWPPSHLRGVRACASAEKKLEFPKQGTEPDRES